ncbi:MAG: hypothetical protein ACUVRY_10150 [Thermoanaerobaculaceae bacterium]
MVLDLQEEAWALVQIFYRQGLPVRGAKVALLTNVRVGPKFA